MHIGAPVASKNLAIRDDVVRRLDLLKRDGESYSDVIARSLQPRPSLLDAIQYARDHPVPGPDTLTPRLRQIRADGNRSAKERMRRLEAVR